MEKYIFCIPLILSLVFYICSQLYSYGGERSEKIRQIKAGNMHVIHNSIICIILLCFCTVMLFTGVILIIIRPE